MTRELVAGDCVRISNPKRGAVIGTIAALTIPAALPALPSHHFDHFKTVSVRRILEEWHVERIAFLSYRWKGPTRSQEVAFVALEIAGAWYDLKRQPLTIEAVQA